MLFFQRLREFSIMVFLHDMRMAKENSLKPFLLKDTRSWKKKDFPYFQRASPTKIASFKILPKENSENWQCIHILSIIKQKKQDMARKDCVMPIKLIKGTLEVKLSNI